MLKVKLVTIGRFWHFHLARQLFMYLCLFKKNLKYPYPSENFPIEKIVSFFR